MADVMVREHFGASSCSHGRHKAGAAQLALLFSLWAAELPRCWCSRAAGGGRRARGDDQLAADGEPDARRPLRRAEHAAVANHVGHSAMPFGCGMGGIAAAARDQPLPEHQPARVNYTPTCRGRCGIGRAARAPPQQGGRDAVRLPRRRLRHSTFWMVFLEVFGYILYPLWVVFFDSTTCATSRRPTAARSTAARTTGSTPLAGNFGRQGVLGYWRWVLWGNACAGGRPHRGAARPPGLVGAALDAGAPPLCRPSAAPVRGVVLALAPTSPRRSSSCSSRRCASRRRASRTPCSTSRAPSSAKRRRLSTTRRRTPSCGSSPAASTCSRSTTSCRRSRASPRHVPQIRHL